MLHTMQQAINSGVLGRLLYLQIDREVVAEQTDGSPTLLTKDQVADAFCTTSTCSEASVAITGACRRSNRASLATASQQPRPR